MARGDTRQLLEVKSGPLYANALFVVATNSMRAALRVTQHMGIKDERVYNQGEDV
jgi:hypothetical protein